MLTAAQSLIRAAAGDRKAATALEYALMASAVAVVAAVGFRASFDEVSAFMANIALS